MPLRRTPVENFFFSSTICNPVAVRQPRTWAISLAHATSEEELGRWKRSTKSAIVYDDQGCESG
jgi:hypothetical protein